jgi:hypothetical protein
MRPWELARMSGRVGAVPLAEWLLAASEMQGGLGRQELHAVIVKRREI